MAGYEVEALQKSSATLLALDVKQKTSGYEILFHATASQTAFWYDFKIFLLFSFPIRNQ